MINNISDEEINALANSILVRYGIDFTCYEPTSLRRRILRIINLYDLTSIQDLWVKFLRERDFVHTFMNEVSVGMTSMFRDPVLWRNLRGHLTREYGNKPVMSAWHAGCSTGEEVYSFGILLKESDLLHKAYAMATDFNRNAIDEAKAGVYHKIKMIENETNYRAYSDTGASFANYYQTDGTHAVMNKELCTHTRFQYHNLVTDTFPTGFDIIFCRNVMIYFDEKTKSTLLNKFHDALNPGGYLIIGFFDTMIHLVDNRKFTLADEEAKIFRKN